MSDIDQHEDGTWALRMPDGRVATSEHREPLERMRDEIRRARSDTALFLDAWKAGVGMAGSDFFTVTAKSIEAAIDKNELRPDCQHIENCASVLSHGERVFLFTLVGFFNRETAQALFRKFNESGHPGELASILGRSRRQIIADLMLTFSGW